MIEYLAPVASRHAALDWLDANKPITRREDGRKMLPNDFPLGTRIILLNERYTPYVLARNYQGAHRGYWHTVEVRNGQVRPAKRGPAAGPKPARKGTLADVLTVEALVREIKNA